MAFYRFIKGLGIRKPAAQSLVQGRGFAHEHCPVSTAVRFLGGQTVCLAGWLVGEWKAIHCGRHETQTPHSLLMAARARCIYRFRTRIV